MCVLVLQLCQTLRDFMVYNLSGSSVQGILLARMLEWISIPFLRGSSWLRDQTWVSHAAGRFFTLWATKKLGIPNGQTAENVAPSPLAASRPPTLSTPDLYVFLALTLPSFLLRDNNQTGQLWGWTGDQSRRQQSVTGQKVLCSCET